ncbi:hypothetical protein GCM10009759_53410 [Kitasatospora saccharophila]|uniref:Excreted virulence factor EspC (Type VII ESX diderm) n=1 Tax=Kitasatospora saccharophila TaxID=407973 RepID=A0ABP5J3A9_9ACTN
MDAEVQKAVTGLDETRDKLRGEVVAPLRAGRSRLPEADEHSLLGSLAALVESLHELADTVVERQYNNRFTRSARTHLEDAADLLRDREKELGRDA